MQNCPLCCHIDKTKNDYFQTKLITTILYSRPFSLNLWNHNIGHNLSKPFSNITNITK